MEICGEARARRGPRDQRPDHLNLDIRQFAQDVIETLRRPGTAARLLAGHRSTRHAFSTPPAARARSCSPRSTSWSRSTRPAWTGWRRFVDDLRASARRRQPREVRDFREDPGRRRPAPQPALLHPQVASSSTTSSAWTSWRRRSRSASCACSSSWWPRSSDVEQIEPLPDIDFNIRAGNTLVGFATASGSTATGQYTSSHDRQTHTAQKMLLERRA